MKIIPAIFFLNALIWIALGISTYWGSSFNMAWILALLMLANAAAMALAGWGLSKNHRLAYYFGLALLAVNILLTVTDQFGLLDTITLVIDLILFGLLIAQRGRYLPKSTKIGE